MHLSKVEMETIICFNEAEQEASIYTCNVALRHKLEKLAKERPDDCKLERTSHEGQAVDYIVPKTWLRVKPPRVASEAQKAAARAALARSRSFNSEP